MSNVKITEEEYLEFISNYDPFKNKDMRFGQEFCNIFNITDPELFSTWDDERAATLITNHVDFQ